MISEEYYLVIWNDKDEDIVLPTKPPKKLSDFYNVALSHYSQGSPFSRCLSHQAKIAYKHHFESGTLAPELKEPDLFGSPVHQPLHDLEVFLRSTQNNGDKPTE
jgi:hypothetical protein